MKNESLESELLREMSVIRAMFLIFFIVQSVVLVRLYYKVEELAITPPTSEVTHISDSEIATPSLIDSINFLLKNITNE